MTRFGGFLLFGVVKCGHWLGLQSEKQSSSLSASTSTELPLNKDGSMEHNPIIAGGSAYLAVANSWGGPYKTRAIKQFFTSISMRPCTECKLLKPISEFGVNSAYHDGLALNCKHCLSSKLKEYRGSRKDAISARTKKYYVANKDKISSRVLARKNKKRASDPMFRLAENIRSAIWRSLKSEGYAKSSSTNEILGCDSSAFCAHIERQFTKGMSWEKLGLEIHIDHIVPLATAKTKEDVFALNHYTNLRPCWADENMRKADKMEFLI